MLNRELEVTLNLAFKEARSKRHEFMTVEHLLLALLDNEAAATVLRACGANLDKLKHDLQEFIDSTTPLIPVMTRTVKPSRPWASSVCCSVPCSTCRAPASAK
jgi:ATP-dependent Clp protease ATP-binding subunit ClpA